MKQYKNIFLSLLFASTLLTSCESLLDVSPEEVLLEEDYLGDNKLDARSALFGVLSQMQEITGQYIVLGEMRADLADVTANAEDDIRQINTHNINPNNKYINPSVLFSIINNCNFAINGIDTEAYDGILEDDYASIMRIRTWAQIQILINYGKLPYITKPIANTQDLKENYPLLTFEQGIDQLIQNLESVAGIENVTKYENSLGYNIFSMIPDNDVLLGDLHLWKGSYVTAATYYKTFLDKNVFNTGSYNLTSNTVATNLSGGNYSVSTGWPSIFLSESVTNNEVINYTAFSDQFRQPNSSFKVLTNQMKPSTLAISNWDSQFKSYLGGATYPGGEGDNRTIPDNNGNPSSYFGSGENARIAKYQYEYFIWNRAARVYLRYAEAINYAGHTEQALAVVNGIFNSTTIPTTSNSPFLNNPESYLNFATGTYYIANSSGTITAGNQGIRGRVDVAPISVDSNLSEQETIQAVGQIILNEAALELAFEGTRWEDLIRFAKRNSDPSIVADAVASKFASAGDAATATTVQQKLMNPDNWFLPLAIPENFKPTN
ncbi:RagB/SusD family nutrient uptake outer membrane protein [Mariniflexile gromovii]|uniref:RagB/SusD family nutrient uptake outer membrane protein n=1 Tax=Mariniflexile gromovii TaxID=362523 RepID=A0ABS4BVD8_9FLAO|nr:RagB/SusD family nutrient uptake outer membrane protein [Mariniflexile gromovii]MBP0903986.1 RagB/SusD family nutrient uptake outer membrane protein [Mariniflexile gromovii]